MSPGQIVARAMWALLTWIDQWPARAAFLLVVLPMVGVLLTSQGCAAVVTDAAALERITAVVQLVIATLVAFGTAAVIRFYGHALRVTPGRQHGLLLWHVVAVSISLNGVWDVLAIGSLDILGIWNTPRWVRLAGYSAFGALTLVSLVIIGVETRRRVQRRPSSTTVVERSSTVIHGDDDPPEPSSSPT